MFDWTKVQTHTDALRLFCILKNNGLSGRQNPSRSGSGRVLRNCKCAD